MDYTQKNTLTILQTLILAISAATFPASLHAEFDPVGNIGAVNPRSTGTAPGQKTRDLTLGESIVFNHRISTSASGSAQVGLIDKSSVSVGPNSDVVIDEYVYKPSQGAASMTLSYARGTMRFIGGQISHTQGITVKAPQVTLGVRGGMVSLDDGPACDGVRVINQYGTITARNRVSEVVLRRPGFAICVTSMDTPIGAPFRVSAQDVSQVVSAVSSRKGQHGGVRDYPTDQMASRLGLGTGCLNDGEGAGGMLDLLSFSASGDQAARNRAQYQRDTRQALIDTRPRNVPPPVDPAPPVEETPVIFNRTTNPNQDVALANITALTGASPFANRALPVGGSAAALAPQGAQFINTGTGVNGPRSANSGVTGHPLPGRARDFAGWGEGTHLTTGCGGR